MQTLKDNYFVIDGRKRFLLGINYLPASSGHSMRIWQAPDYGEIDRDMAAIRKLGIDAVRLPLPFTMVDEKGKVDESMLTVLDRIVEIAGKNGLSLVPNFFHTGGAHMGSGKVPSWLTPREFYSSDASMANLTSCLRAVVSRYASDKRVIAWDICNEPWWFIGFLPPEASGTPDRALFDSWLRRLSEAMRAIPHDQPFTAGCDYPAVSQQVGGDVESFARYADFVGMHFYSRYAAGMTISDPVNTFRDSLFGPFVLKFSQFNRCPFGSMEFGFSTGENSEEQQARSFRLALFSSLTNGANSMFPWNFKDFDPSIRSIYDKGGAQELFFGITRSNGEPKPAAAEIKSFGEFCRSVDLEKYSLPDPRAAIYVHLDYFSDQPVAKHAYLNSFLLAKYAQLAVDFARFDDDLSRYELLFVPYSALPISEQDRAREFWNAGKTLYISMHKYIHLHSTRYLADVLGCTLEDELRLPPRLTVKVVKSLGALKKGMSFTFEDSYRRMGQNTDGYLYYFKVKPDAAEVLAVDEKGNPMILLNRRGQAACLSVMFPMEYYLGLMNAPYSTNACGAVYTTVRQLSAIRPAVVSDDPFIQPGCFTAADGSMRIVLANHDAVPRKTRLIFSGPRPELSDWKTGKKIPASAGLAFGPNEVRLFNAAPRRR